MAEVFVEQPLASPGSAKYVKTEADFFSGWLPLENLGGLQ